MDEFTQCEEQANEYMKCWYRTKKKQGIPLSKLVDSNRMDGFDHLFYSAGTLVYVEWKIREEPSNKYDAWLIEAAKVNALRTIYQAHRAMNKMQEHYDKDQAVVAPLPLLLFFSLCSDGKLYIFNLNDPPAYVEKRKAKRKTKNPSSDVVMKDFYFYRASQAIETFQFQNKKK